MLLEIFLVILLVMLSGFFSMSETSLFSLSRIKLENITQKFPKRANIIISLLKDPQKLLVTILMCNIFVNIMTPLVLQKIFGFTKYSYIIALLISAVVILIFGEVTPKTFAIKAASKLSLIVSPVIYFLMIILTPFVFVFRKLSMFLVFINSHIFYENAKEPTSFHSEAVIDVIKESQDRGVLDTEEGNILGNIIKFTNYDIYKMLKPRNEIFSLPITKNLDEARQLIKEKKYSRIPVWEDEEENIIGVLHVKDLIKIKGKKRTLSYYRNILKKPFFVPDSIKPDQLLKNFQAMRNRLAIVIDEYGGIAGLVTLEDVLEEIIGDVIDKDDIKPLYYKYNLNVIEIEAKMEISDFNKVFKTNIKAEDSNSVGGYILEEIRRIPSSGETIKIKNLQFKISKATTNKIEKIMVTKLHKREKA